MSAVFCDQLYNCTAYDNTIRRFGNLCRLIRCVDTEANRCRNAADRGVAIGRHGYPHDQNQRRPDPDELCQINIFADAFPVSRRLVPQQGAPESRSVRHVVVRCSGQNAVRSLSRRVVCPGGQERTVRMERTRQGHDRLFATRGLSLCRIPLPRRWRMPEEFGIQYRYLDSGYLPALHLHHSLRPTSQHKKRQGLSQRRAVGALRRRRTTQRNPLIL